MNLTDDDKEWLDERAAIIEAEAHLVRLDAECLAAGGWALRKQDKLGLSDDLTADLREAAIRYLRESGNAVARTRA